MIKFGTSGWRAIIADEFTFAAVRKVSQAIANYLKASSENHRIIIGYDTRFMAEVFAAECANRFASEGFETWLCDRATPTPAILLVAEMVAKRGTTLVEMLEKIYREVGKLVSGRIGVRLTPELQQKLPEKLENAPTEFARRQIKEINRID